VALRLVNTVPGDVSSPVRPGQLFHLGLKSETQNVQLASVQVDSGFSNIQNHGVLPENDTTSERIGVETSFSTSENRAPVSGSVTKSLSSGSVVLTKTTNSLFEEGIYRLKFPIQQGASILGYFKFRKKSAWTTYNPDWCSLTNMVGMYFGLEHGTFNTAAYAFLRDNGSGGSIVFGGPLQSYSTARPGQTEIAQDLDPVTGGSQGWMGLANDSVLELFIRFNTFVNPFRAELWTRIASSTLPVFQGSILVGALGQFPSMLFTNGREGTSETASLFFGNIGRSGDILQLDDWGLFPDFRSSIRNGLATSDSEVLTLPDLPLQFRAKDSVSPTDVKVGRWFEAGSLPMASSFFYQPGTFLKPQHLSLSKSTGGDMTFKRTEPRLEERADGVMMEAFVSAESISRIGDLVGGGFGFNDGLNLYQVAPLETVTERNWGLLTSTALATSTAGYLTPALENDFRSPKLLRVLLDRRRGKVSMEIDDVEVVSAPTSAPAQISSTTQAFPLTSFTGTTLNTQVSTDGGTTWIPRSHTFSSTPTDIAGIVSALNGNAVWTGSGPSQIEAVDRGSFFSIRTIGTGSLLGIGVLASTAIGTGKLALTIQNSFGSQTSFPLSGSTTGRVEFGHPSSLAYESKFNLSSLTYLSRFLSWHSEDSLKPDSVALPSSIRFTYNTTGLNIETASPTEFTLTKGEFSNSSFKAFYKKDQSLTDVGSAQIDFKMQVVGYTDDLGRVNAPSTSVDAGICIFLGNKRLRLAFFDCGIGGRKIGVVPGSGSESDILNQTPLGIKFSSEVDWTVLNQYRVVVQAFQSIRVWAGSFMAEPLITIPWRNATDGFDLPLDVTTPGVAFGHFNHFTLPSSSTTKWKFFRWGHSNGYEVAVGQKFSSGVPSYAFGGKAFILSEFNESP
jgi:hypothetical protein